MAILVQYRDKTFDAVSKEDLDSLIDSRQIIAFRRSGGWVDIGSAPLRRRDVGQEYKGPERRGSREVVFQMQR